MFCPKCGKENKSNQKWCCYCGTILDISSGEVQSEKPQAEERSTARKPQKNESPQQNTTQKLRGTQKKAPKRRKSSKGTIAVIAGVLILAAVIAVCLFIIPSGNRHKQNLNNTKTISDFSSSWLYFAAGETENVVFTVKASEAPTLFLERDAVGRMHDDGKNGDDIEGDGVYSFAIIAVSSVEKQDTYYAGFESPVSDPITLHYYDSPTEEEIQQFVISQKQIDLITAPYTNSDGTVSEDQKDNAMNSVTDYAEKLLLEDIVSEYHLNDDNVYIRFSSGLTYMYAPIIEGLLSGGDSAQLQIITCQPFKTEFPNTALNSIASDIVNRFDHCKLFAHPEDDLVTTQMIKDYFGPNQIILWFGHGTYDAGVHSVLITGEPVIDGVLNCEDIISGRILVCGWWLGISSKFIEHYCKRMDNSLVYLNSCLSGKTAHLARSFIDKGSASVICNTKTIKTTYAHYIQARTIDNLLYLNSATGNFNTISEALSLAKAEFGDTDINYGGKGAEARIFGKLDYRISSMQKGLSDLWSEIYENYALNQNAVYENDPNLIDTKSFTLDGLKYYKDRYSEPKFALYDIDGNGTPELIIFNGSSIMAEAQCYVFTCDNGQLKYAGPIGFRGCALYFYPEGQYRGLFCSDGNMGQFRTYYYSIKDGAAAQELVKEYTFDDTGKVVNTPATSNKGLYEQSTGGDGTALPFFTIGEIREMGWETFVQKALNPEASPKADGLAVFDSDEQYDMNIYLSNISEQRAFEKNGYNGYSWNHEDLVNFAFTWCKINRYSALGSAEDGGHYFFTLPLDTVNEVLKRFFNITLYDQDMRREHLPDPYSPSAYNFYRDGYFYYPAASGEMHYNYLSVVKQKEPAGQGQYTLYFDVYALLDSVYKANDYSVPKDFYRLSSEKAASDPGLTMVASGKAFIREYEENGMTQRYIVEYSMD